jgi:hypothetical protein
MSVFRFAKENGCIHCCDSFIEDCSRARIPILVCVLRRSGVESCVVPLAANDDRQFRLVGSFPLCRVELSERFLNLGQLLVDDGQVLTLHAR